MEGIQKNTTNTEAKNYGRFLHQPRLSDYIKEWNEKWADFSIETDEKCTDFFSNTIIMHCRIIIIWCISYKITGDEHRMNEKYLFSKMVVI